MSQQEEEPLIKSWKAGSSKKEVDDVHVSVAPEAAKGGGPGRLIILGFALPVLAFSAFLGIRFFVQGNVPGGTKDPDFLKVIEGAQAPLAGCLAEARKDNPDLAGTVEISAAVAKDGKSNQVFVTRQSGDPTEIFPPAALKECVEKEIGKLTWPKARDDKRLAAVKVEVPLLEGEGLANEKIMPSIEEIKPNLLICFQVPDINEDVAVQVRLNITASGRVHKPEIASPESMRDSKFERCMLQELKNLAFEASGKGATGVVFELAVPAFDPYAGQPEIAAADFVKAMNAALVAAESAVQVSQTKNGFAIRCPGAKTTLPRTYSPLTEGSAQGFANKAIQDCEASAEQATVEGATKELSARLASLKAQLGKTAVNTGCKAADECAIAYLGAAPCAEGAVVAFNSKVADIGKIEFILAAYAEAESNLFELEGNVPECEIPPPTATCTAGKCVADPNGEAVPLVSELTAAAAEALSSQEAKLITPCGPKNKFKGEVPVTLTISKGGKVTAVKFLKPKQKKNKPLTKCISTAAKKLVFPSAYGNLTRTFKFE